MVSLEGLYPHLPSVTLALPTPVLSRLRHFHFVQLSSAPGGSCSLATIPIVVEGGRLLFISSHIVNLASLVVVSASRGLTWPEFAVKVKIVHVFHKVTLKLSSTCSCISVCLLPALYGWCQGDTMHVTTRWYWDMFAHTCFGFPYEGCGGNSNNFKTKEDCLRKCSHRNVVVPPLPTQNDLINVPIWIISWHKYNT